MASIRQHYNKWKAKVPVPRALVGMVGKEFIYRTLDCRDRRAALAETAAWEAAVRAEWAAAQAHDSPALANVRQVYGRVRKEAVEASLSTKEALADIDVQLEHIAAAKEGQEPSPTVPARVAALNDAAKERKGVPVTPRSEFESSFNELAADYLKRWKRLGGLKGDTNTEQQKRATL